LSATSVVLDLSSYRPHNRTWTKFTSQSLRALGHVGAQSQPSFAGQKVIRGVLSHAILRGATVSVSDLGPNNEAMHRGSMLRSLISSPKESSRRVVEIKDAKRGWASHSLGAESSNLLAA
jgi:hypothetical protein